MDLSQHGIVAEALELSEIAETQALLERGLGASLFSTGELAYARSKSDPARRLAARRAAKQAALRLLGAGLDFGDVEVTRGRGGPPGLALSPRAEQRLRALGASRALVSLTHGLTHAAAWVLLLS